ncbi:MAG: ABC transporter substrate-binding protein [Deltaproteobacteria bacterium]|nr:ABC transporter substrate-binding protein [Deltaproteobacteria bacterium]
MQTLVLGSTSLMVLLMSSGLLIGAAGAAERARPFLIGALTASWGPTPAVTGLRDGLRDLGYREGEQFVLGVRFTQGDLGALPAAARELVQQGVDLIFASGQSAKAAQGASAQIPIVFAGEADPLGMGLIQSFARPGGNITGVTDLGVELSAKRLEVFRTIIPGLKRVLFPYDPTDLHAVAEGRGYRDAANRLGVELVAWEVRTPEEAQTVLSRVRQGDVDGILAPQNLALNLPGFILEASAQRMAPTMFSTAFWVEQGGLVSYGPNFYESGRQAARLVDKILKGAQPGEIPVEVNPKIELVINLKVAQALGLTIAPQVLFQADRVVR